MPLVAIELGRYRHFGLRQSRLQGGFLAKRLKDIQTLYESGANTEFREQDNQVQFETVSAQLGAARAAQQGAKLALDSEINGVNTTVAQI